MKFAPFKLERYFEKHEFSAPYLLSCSDCESVSMTDVLSWGDPLVKDLWRNLDLGYTETRGHPLLRREIAELYHGMNEEHILVCTPGEGIFLAMNVLLQEGDHVITMFPAYQSLYEIALGLGCSLDRWQPRLGDIWTFNLRDLELLIKKETRLIVLNLPHNPTGAMMNVGDFREILDMASRLGIYVFCDEMYRYLEFNEESRLPSAAQEYKKAVSLCGLSKSFGLPGLRIGWLSSKDKALMENLASLKDYTTICCSAPSEILAIGALRSRELLIRRNLGIIKNNILALEQFFANYANVVSWIPPQAGTLALCRLAGLLDSSVFCAGALEKEGVLLVPGDLMDAGRSFFRIGFGRKNMPEALARLARYIEKIAV